MNFLTYDAEADLLIAAAGSSSDLPDRTALLMRIIAARLQHEAGIPHQYAEIYNQLLTKAMRIALKMSQPFGWKEKVS